MRRRCREPGRRRRISWALAGGAPFWVGGTILVMLAAEAALKARTRHYLEQLERSEGQLARIEASLWLRSRGDRRSGECSGPFMPTSWST